MAIWRFDAIGTSWEIETAQDLSVAERDAVGVEIERFDREWSRFREDSAVTRVSREGGSIVSSDSGAMLDAYRELTAATDGAVNPLVGDSLAALGYDASYSLVAGAPVVAPADWTDRLRWNAGEATASAPALVDVGALGKGRLVDIVSEVLADVPGSLVVDAGGDMRVRGDVVRVGLEHPYDPAKAIGVVELQDAALCASAVNRRAWGDGTSSRARCAHRCAGAHVGGDLGDRPGRDAGRMPSPRRCSSTAGPRSPPPGVSSGCG